MNIRHIESFLVVAETLHFGEAARRLHITQPPLSRQIALLEQSLGVSLFERHGRSISLTAAGEYFRRAVQGMLQDWQQIARTTAAVARGERGELRIGFTMCAAWSVIPDLLADYRQYQPQVTVRLVETLPSELQQGLVANDIDVGVSFPGAMAGAAEPCYVSLHQEPMVAVLPGDHPLAGEAILRLSSLADDGFVTFPAATAPELHACLMANCQASGFQPRVVLETQLQQTIVNLVARGLGVSLVPASMQKMQLAGAVFVPLESSVQVEQGVYYQPDNQNPCLRDFLNWMSRWVSLTCVKTR